MKTFLNYLKEEVTPTALSDGSIDIEKDSVRQEINGILSGISTYSCVTPYSALTKIRKALAYFHVYLPKRSYMEGNHGVEVWEIHQFGQKMGMTDQGEFINDTPVKFYLFFHYHLVGSMFMINAKVVDKTQLDKELDFAESMIKEDAEMRQGRAKAIAPKEEPHTALGDCDCSQGDSPSTKSAVSVMMRRKDKKLSSGELDEGRMPASVIKHKQKLASMSPDDLKKKFAGKSEQELKSMAHRHGYGKDSDVYSKHVTVKEDNLDEVSLGKLVRYKNKAGEGREKGIALADKKMKGKAKVNTSMPKHPYMEETDAADETNMAKSQLKAIGAKSSNLASMMKNPKNLPAWVQSKLSVAKDGITSVDDYMTHSDKKLDEAKEDKHFSKQSKAMQTAINNHLRKGKSYKEAVAAAKQHVKEGLTVEPVNRPNDSSSSPNPTSSDVSNPSQETKSRARMGATPAVRESAPSGAKFERMIKHIKKGYSKDGLTAKEKGIAYATAWKAKKNENREKEQTGKKKTVLVTLKGDPHAATGGGVKRISKKEYDPSKHNMASE
jgi:hypothetical protein